jgi:putative hydrolase of the HAD superfamily
VKKYQAVIFDLDDTLYPEREYVRSGFQSVADYAEQKLGFPREKSFNELMELFHQGVRNHTFDKWLNDHQIHLDIVPRLVQVYREHQPEIRTFDEIPELLSALKRKCRLALLSDGYLVTQAKKLASLQIAPYFDAVIFSDEYGRDTWKPNPKIYRIALEKLGVSASDAVYVSDNPAKDFLGARRVQLPTIRLRIPSGLYAADSPPDSDYAPDMEVFSHTELSDLLLSNI